MLLHRVFILSQYSTRKKTLRLVHIECCRTQRRQLLHMKSIYLHVEIYRNTYMYDVFGYANLHNRFEY